MLNWLRQWLNARFGPPAPLAAEPTSRPKLSICLTGSRVRQIGLEMERLTSAELAHKEGCQHCSNLLEGEQRRLWQSMKAELKPKPRTRGKSRRR